MSIQTLKCQQCGHTNISTMSACTACGAQLHITQSRWSSVRKTREEDDRPLEVEEAPERPNQQVTRDYRCPYCGSPYPPQIVKRLSGVGWAVLILGLLFCLV